MADDDTQRKDPVASIAGQLPHLSTADRATLRRLYLTGSREADGVVLGLMYHAALPTHLPGAFDRWKLIAHVAATLSGTAARQPHSPANALGAALFRVGYSEARLMRLTTARGPALTDQIVRAARYLARSSDAVPVDLRPLSGLTSPDRATAERARLQIAREYFAARYRAANHREPA
jgi:hypothetical protein